ncbi:MAG: C10 family peptidase [bacterium]|nr:C10 family peptidase [bacterium]
MRKFLISLVVLFLGNFLFAAPVSIQTAEKVAKNWYYDKGNLTKSEISVTNNFIESSDKGNVFYIFNFKPNGFVIVSAEDATVPILGYSFEGQYTAANHPIQFDEWMNNYKEQIIYAREHITKAPRQNADQWNNLIIEPQYFVKGAKEKAVSPFITTTWAQENISASTPVIYNTQCPTIGSTHCLVGCAAVAMGQIMKYYNHPTQGVGSHSYYDTAGCAQTVSANFGTTTYDWTNMPNSLSSSTTTQRNAVGTLLFHCGVAVNMRYGTSASGAYVPSPVYALKTYFSYNENLGIIYKSSYADTVWARIMRTELDSSRPVLYSGQGSGGHAFVMDGYSTNTYFHFNWGWEGSENGYFYLNDLTPASYNFNSNQGAIILIKPAVPTPDIAVSPDTLRFTWTGSKKSLLSPSTKGITDTLIYDTGTPGGVLGVSANWGLALRFSPEIYPCTLKSVIWYPYKKDTSCEAHIWDASGAGGAPGSNLVTAFTYTPAVSNAWDKKDLPTPVAIDAGDFWVGWMQKAGNIFGNIANVPANTGRSFYYSGTWQVIDVAHFGTTADLMIRAVVTSGSYDTVRTLVVSNPGTATLNISNITVSDSWITAVTPTVFNVSAKGTQNVTVTVTKDGLSTGYHYGHLTITSNDPDESPTTVPVKFYIPSSTPDIAVTQDTLRFTWDDSGKKALSYSCPPKEAYVDNKSVLTKNNVCLSGKTENKKFAPSIKVAESSNQSPLTFSYLDSKATLDTLIYDNGTTTSTWAWVPGTRMGTRMTPTGACKVIAIQAYCPKAETYKIGLYNWTGSTPGSQLLETGTISATAAGWNTTDISSSNINVTTDFVASFNPVDTVGRIGANETDNQRAWDYDGSSWSLFPNNTYFIRAIVSYGGGSSIHDTLQTMTVRNDGGGDLNVTNITKSQSWITSVSPTSFTVPAGSSQNVTVIVNKTGLSNGTHLGNLTITSDDPDESSYVEPVKFVVVHLGVEENQNFSFNLSQNYPNPANSETQIEYALPNATKVTLKIYDATGRPVRTLLQEEQAAGKYKAFWNGKDDKGNKLGNGIYFYRLETDKSVTTKKLTLLK